ncbi:ATP-binding cassette domain-containing protein [Parapedobacter sp. GCM10030251]|uniref:ATP-binding cassette domain-containing protein n=1 Tax=Parapedobacter sp. GCM10030251 TaxID=3273419 RepID=UPI0036108121
MANGQELFIDSVACRFGNRTVLSGVHIACKPGEVVGLLGRNGSGKSTLLKVIFGTLNGRYKYCLLDGVRFTKGYRTRAIAYLPQHPFIPANTRVRSALEHLAHTYRQDLLAIGSIRENLDARMHELSGGIRRMIEALLIIYTDARYVLLDEPFSNIAPLYIDELSDHMNRLKATKGFIVTDHYYQRVLDISDRMVLLNNGCNYRIDKPEDLYTYGYIPASAFE